MRAAVWEGPGRLEFKDVPDPECPRDGVLLRVLACGVSGGDVRLFFDGDDGVQPPWTFGHEICGELVDVGAGVDTEFPLSMGRRVQVISTLTCGRCDMCRRGWEHVCRQGMRLGRQLRGGFAELVALPAMALRNIYPVPDQLPSEHATFADPLSDVICGHKDLDIGVGETAVVIGAGPVGGAHAILARAQGAEVIILERLARRLELAQAVLGESRMTYVDASEQDPVEFVLQATNGRGAETVIVACASPAAQEQAIEMAARRGRVLYFSDLVPGHSYIRFPVNHQYEREIAVLGSYASRYVDQERALGMLARDDDNVRAMISETLKLDELPAACARVRAGEVLKVVVIP